MPAVEASFGNPVGASLISAYKIPVGPWMAALVERIKSHSGLFDAVTMVLGSAVNGLTRLLTAIPPLAIVALIAGLAWWLRRSIPLAAFIAVALLFIMNQGYWSATMETLSLVVFAALVSTMIGVPVGICGGASAPRVSAGCGRCST